MLLCAELTQHLFPQASELGHSLNENVLKPAQEKVWVAPKSRCLCVPLRLFTDLGNGYVGDLQNLASNLLQSRWPWASFS